MATKSKKEERKEKREKEINARIESALKNSEEYRENVPSKIASYVPTYNISKENNTIFFRDGTTALTVYALYLKYSPKGEEEKSIVSKIAFKIVDLFKAKLFASGNPLGRVNRIVSEIRKLKRLNGNLNSYSDVKKRLSPEVLKIIEAE